MKNTRKKGFTIVELVIVIAVIAILAAVLIPTFSNIIARSKISADTQLCRNLNTVLTMATSEGRVPQSMYDVLYLISESGYLLGNLNPTAEGYYFAWDTVGQKIVYIQNDLDTVMYPEDYTIDKSKCWITVGDQEEAERVAQAGYNLYLERSIDLIKLDDCAVSIDTGAYTLGELQINGSVADPKSIVLSGNFKNMSVGIANVTSTVSGSIQSLNVSGNNAAMSINGNVNSVTSSLSNSINMGSTGYIGSVNGGSVVTGSGSLVSNGSATGAVNGVVTLSNKEAIENVRTQIAGGRTFAGETVTLSNDINMAGIAFQPISNFSRESSDVTKFFQGTFDGQGHTIQNFSTTGFAIAGLNAGTNSTTPYFGSSKIQYNEAVYGLFGSVKNAVIKNVNVTCAIEIVLDDANHYVGDSVGGIVGFATGDYVTFENCTVSGYINAYDGVGGFLGRTKAKETTFTNCTNNATITGVRKTGAFVGSSYDGNYTVVYNNCVNNGNVSCLGIVKDVELGAWNSGGTAQLTATLSSNGSGYYVASASNGEYLSADNNGTHTSITYKNSNNTKTEYTITITVNGFANNGVIKVGDEIVGNGTYMDYNPSFVHQDKKNDTNHIMKKGS